MKKLFVLCGGVLGILPFCIVLSIVTLMIGGCASTSSLKVEYLDAPGIYAQARLGPAKITSADERTLLAPKYCKIGSISASVDEGQGTKDDLRSKILDKAGQKGGDVVLMEADEVKSETRLKNGACLREEVHSEQVMVDKYRNKCEYDPIFKERRRESVYDGFEYKPRTVRTCKEWEQIPYTVKVLRSKGTVWRNDPDLCSELGKPRASSNMMDASLSSSNEPERSDGETQHQVTISKPFYMRTTVVTQGQ